MRGIPKPEFYDGRFVYDRCKGTYTCPSGKMLKRISVAASHGKTIHRYGTGECFSCPHYMTACTTSMYGRKIDRWEHQEIIEDMNMCMKSTRGKTIADGRKCLSEHPFGTMKRAFDQGYLLLKGLRKVKGEIGFTIIAYNMRRAITLVGTDGLIRAVHENMARRFLPSSKTA